MKSETLLDYALFQLSPKRSRCELFVSRDGNSEKLASGLVKPFVTHLKIAEEQVALSSQSIKLEVEQRKNGDMWFSKGTLERFVRFVSTPEVLEMVNTFDAEMSQLESARVIYSQGVEDQPSSKLSGGGPGTTAAADATKKELLRAIDVRLAAVKQDLITACARAAAAGFNPSAVSELQMFADQFGAYRLNEACSKFISLCERRPDLINPWKSGVDDRTVRSSYGSDMSIDDDPSIDQLARPHQPHISSAGQQSNSSSLTFPLRRTNGESSIEKDDTSSARENREDDSSGGSEAVLPVTQPGAPARRLSVQDRISLFENKQKETSSGSGGKPIIAKSAELQKLSSDVSSGSAAAEKAVLRRWSGVSDMSISLDLSGEKKEVNSPLCTPSVSSASQAKSDDPKRLITTSDKPEFKSIPAISGDNCSKDQADSSAGDRANSETVSSGQAKTQSSSSLTLAGVKNQATSQNHSRSSSLDRADWFGFKDQGRSKGSSGNGEQSGTIEQVTTETHIARLKEVGGPQLKPGAFASKSGDVRSVKESCQPSEAEDFQPRNQSVSQPQLMAPLKAAMDSGQLESGSKIREAFAAQYKGPEGMLLGSQSSWKSLREIEEVDLASFQKQSDSFMTKVEDSGIPRMKVQQQISVREHIRKPQNRRNESNSVYGNNSILFSHKMVSEDKEDFGTTPVTPAEQVQRIRQSKGNQELNDELKMKANELEKLFAEHKLRAPGDQSNSARRSKPTDVQIEQASSLPDGKQVAEITPSQFLDSNPVIDTLGSLCNVVKLTDGLLVKLDESQDYGETLKCNIPDLGLSDDSRGKFYDMYMQKRDAKLWEEWGSRRTEKEAKLKAMQDSFERSRTEMRVKLSGPADRQDPIYSVRRRAERLGSFTTRSILKMEQQPLDFLQSEDDGDAFELLEQKPFGQDRSFGDISLGNGVSRSSQTKRLLPNRNLSSSTPRNSAAPVPRSASKASNSGSIRRRMQSDNPHMQSVPNFSELRKENTKPYSAGSKIVRPQLRNYTRSRSTSEEIPHVKEEKARRSQSLRKSTASPAEFKDMSSLNSEGVVLTPLKFDIEQAEQGRYDKFSKCMESKPFFQKNNSIGRGAGAGDAKLKASMVSESFSNDEESDELTFDPEDSVDIGKDEDEESLTRTSEDLVNMDHREPSLSQESAKLINSGSEHGDALQSFSQDPSLLPSSVPSTFLPIGSVLDSPGESPTSWSSRIHHPFTYHHEVSDIDASADSPIGSPASWNLHPLNQTESDAARMRKKWGSAQKPIIGANSSNNQSRKDMTKGFKRLLKFGRKSRGTEGLVDWISATTSEGDDDAEDGRDLANRSSDDLRKSRMGFLRGHASEDSFTESEYFSEQVQGLNSSIPAPPANFKLREDLLSGSSMKGPRSFFSLSSFRSKGSESKLR